MAETVVTAPPPATPGLLSRARTDGVTGPAVVALSVVLVACGVALDLRRDATLGLGTGVAFVLAALAGPAVVRFRSLATALVLQPLLFCGAAAALARLGGQNRGSREVALDVGDHARAVGTAAVRGRGGSPRGRCSSASAGTSPLVADEPATGLQP